MQSLLNNLRAAAESTRLRLLALAARGTFCVMEFGEILGQSQPRLSRHLKLLCECGLLSRDREGANVWFTLPDDDHGALARDLIARLPADDPVLEADRRQAARVLAERARIASDSFRRRGADWDEMRALELPAQAVETAFLELLSTVDTERLLDIGTGTGRVLELLAPRVRRALGIDASKSMLALARARLSSAAFSHCTVRLADMYRLPLADASFDTAVLQMILHYAEDPAGVLVEAARVLRPGGRMIVIDLASHTREDVVSRLAHRWPGFTDASMHALLTSAGLECADSVTIPGPLDVRIWSAVRLATVPTADRHALAV